MKARIIHYSLSIIVLIIFVACMNAGWKIPMRKAALNNELATHMDENSLQSDTAESEDMTEYTPPTEASGDGDDDDDMESGESTPEGEGEPAETIMPSDTQQNMAGPNKTIDKETAPAAPVQQSTHPEEPSNMPARTSADKMHEAGDELEAAAEEVPEEVYQDDLGDPDAVNLKAKRAMVLELIDKGEKYFQAHKAYDAFHAFTHTPEFLIGELYLFVLDTDGTFMAHGQNTDLVWRNLINMRDSFGTPFVKAMLKKAHRGGGWVTYQWRDATKIAYVKEIKKDNKVFVIGCGYYPHSKADAVVSLVKGAVAMFKQAMKENRSTEEVFSTFSYPLGRFVFGDLYLYALDFNGVQVAHGDRPGLIGTSALDYRDSHGKYVNKEFIAKLKGGADGVWIDYFSKNAEKRAYGEKVTDNNGKDYFIACGYYPTAGRDELVDLVRRGYEYMKSHGESIAAREFSDKKINTFRYGDLFLTVYNMKGKCVAHGGNPDFVGQNFYNDKDQDGNYYVRDMLKKAEQLKLTSGGGEAAGGWVNYKLKNSFVSAYIKPVRLGLKEYVISGGVFPITKKETAVLLAQSGAGFLRTEAEKVALGEFVKTEGKFIQGDLDVFVFAFNGICLAYGDSYDYIWRDMLDVKDDKGLPYVQVFINTVKQGAGQVTYTINGQQRVVFLDKVDKNGNSFVVGSGYFK